MGDTAGALQDFDRVRILPDDQLRYLEDLKRRDSRLMASRNYAVINDYIDSLLANKITNAGLVQGANIEHLGEQDPAQR